MAASKKPRKKKRQIHPWQEIRSVYVTDETVSLREVARRYKVDARMLGAKASADGWTAEKEAFQARVQEEARRAAIARLTSIASKSAAEALAQLSATRERLLNRAAVDLAAERPVIAESKIERIHRDAETKETVVRSRTKRRPRLEPQLAAAVIKAELDLLRAILGIDPRAKANDDDEIRIE